VILKSRRVQLVIAVIGLLAFASRGGALMAASDASPTAPIGAAKVDITPQQPVRMYGYSSRVTESEGVAGRLQAAALAIGGDEGDGPAVLLTVDNGATPAEIRSEVLRRLQAKTALKDERLMLCNAHIHSGPDLKGMASLAGEQHEHMASYQKELTDKLEQVVLAALKARRPGRLAWAQGSVGFAANRRVLKDGKWSGFGAEIGRASCRERV
jgi:neutral ceramidase